MSTKQPRKYKPYTAYRFKTHDPVMNLFAVAKDEKGDKVSAIARESGVSSSTLSNWFGKKTRRPQFATVAAVARSMGIENEVALLIRGNRYR